MGNAKTLAWMEDATATTLGCGMGDAIGGRAGRGGVDERMWAIALGGGVRALGGGQAAVLLEA